MNRAGFLARIGGAVVAGLVGRKAVAEEPPMRPDYPLGVVTGGTLEGPVPHFDDLDIVIQRQREERLAREVLRQIEREAARAPRPNPFIVL